LIKISEKIAKDFTLASGFYLSHFQYNREVVLVPYTEPVIQGANFQCRPPFNRLIKSGRGTSSGRVGGIKSFVTNIEEIINRLYPELLDL